MRIVAQPPMMRHFTARFAWLSPEDAEREASSGAPRLALAPHSH
jgi:hypothetical protein